MLNDLVILGKGFWYHAKEHLDTDLVSYGYICLYGCNFLYVYLENILRLIMST
jgi:hypothetical protein